MNTKNPILTTDNAPEGYIADLCDLPETDGVFVVTPIIEEAQSNHSNSIVMDTRPKRRFIPAIIAATLGAVGIAPAVATMMAAQGDTVARDMAIRQLGERQAPARSNAQTPLKCMDLPSDPHFSLRPRGMTPKEWGYSPACARMVRKSKLRKLGISGQRS